jgi:hypothetical protein
MVRLPPWVGRLAIRFPLTRRELAIRAGENTLRARVRGDK